MFATFAYCRQALPVDAERQSFAIAKRSKQLAERSFRR